MRLAVYIERASAAIIVAYGLTAFGDEPKAAETLSVPGIRFAANPGEPMPLPPVDAKTGGNLLSLSEVESLATAHYPALREAAGQVQAARGTWLQEGLRPNPTIGYMSDDVGNSGTAGKQGAFVSQEFVTAGKLGINRAVAEREVSAVEQRFERVRLQIITTARTYYYEVLAADRAADLAVELEKMRSLAVQASETRSKAGEGSRASLLQSNVEYERAALRVEQATDRRDAAWRQLAAVTGIDATMRPKLEDKLNDPLPEFSWDSARQQLLDHSPELAELREDVERAKWAVAQAKAGRVPNLTAQGGVQYDNIVNETTAAAQLSMPLPLFNRNQGNIARACGELTAAQAALEARQLSLEQRLATALRDYHTSSRQAKKYTESILPVARQSLDVVTQAYQQGESDYLQLLTSQQSYTESNLDYLRDLETAWKQWAAIDGLLVGLLPDVTN